MKVTEKQIREIIVSVLNENRKVLKIGSSEPAVSPMPDPMAMQQDMMQQPPMMDPNMDTDMEGPQDDGLENQFDTDFDAGVEADEDSDPKHYIQQLTGKLSQSINSFNGEQGADTGLCKYVASMIIAATCKNLDDKVKKELIEKINSANAGEEEMPEEPGDEEIPQDEVPPEEPQAQQPMMEHILTVRELRELTQGIECRQDNLPDKKQKGSKKTIFSGKPF